MTDQSVIEAVVSFQVIGVDIVGFAISLPGLTLNLIYFVP